MNLSLFTSFSKSIEELPTRAIPSLLELEEKMIKDDIALHRPVPLDGAESILEFCRFVREERAGFHVSSHQGLPLAHSTLYRRIIKKMVEAGELPAAAKEEFDTEFFARSAEIGAGQTRPSCSIPL
jgi:hypothetical protein